jgi:polysaccharide biosynthesis/export protein
VTNQIRMNTFVASTAALVAAAHLGAQSLPAIEPVPPLGTSQTPAAARTAPASRPLIANAVEVPVGYVIGPEDVLTVVFWRDKDMSAEVSVRPDGKITLPLINEIEAANLTPDQLREKVTQAAAKFIEEPNVTVVVKAINSRKAYITGNVARAGAYPLIAPTTVMQLIAMAGGLHEFADSKNIIITRLENGKQVAFRFNYKDFLKRKNLKQNIELRPGDTVVVP